jgi:hypothetical protein
LVNVSVLEVTATFGLPFPPEIRNFEVPGSTLRKAVRKK